MGLSAFNAQKLKERLVKLDDKRRLAFGVLCCERLLPNYVAFQQNTGGGDVAPIRRALDIIVRSSLLSGPVVSVEIADLTVSCESVAPMSEDYDSLNVTSAQDACLAVCCLLDYLLDSDVDKVVQIATFATDSVDLYVQEIEHMNPRDPDLEEKISNHFLMQRELAQQENDSSALEDFDFLSPELLEKLTKSWGNDGKSNLDLP